jgi:photosystem II stability/assembly factor-like uncharacterized protein
MHARKHFLIPLALVIFATFPLRLEANGRIVEAILDKLEWRNIGPAIMGGRINDFAVVESDPRIIYAATASAGLWRTTNNGITWEPLFDDQPVSTIGDVAVAPSDPSKIWVGTGEPNNRQSSSWGNGVYKSTDGGKSWTHVGLTDTHHIGRVVIHPRNPDVVYVAAVGHLWGPNKERGLYKTTDGGQTWTNTKFINEDTGFIDVAMDPKSPDTLYAAAYQRRRRVFGFNGGGPGSGLYKTTDGGATWTRLTQGLPEGDTGRIGIDVYRQNPNIVYAIIENANGGVFRSEDKGASWTRMSETNPRPMYYSQIRVDPQNDQRIWALGAPMYYSEDGGRNFRTDLVTRIHGDYHAMWINPENSDHLVVGSDGGIHLSYDRGRTWDYVNTLALGQFYEIGFDMDKPYRIYGGLQDNGSWGGPVRTPFRQGITNEDWMRVGGGDGFYAQVDWSDPSTVYTESQDGNLGRLNLKTLERKNIKPEPKPGEPAYRFDWNSPIVVSTHDPKTLYFGGNRLFKSSNRGDSWTASPDLSKNLDRDEMPIMGVVPNEKTLSRHDGIQTYGQIVTVSESPLKQGLLYVGTDDGNLQVSRDGGETWRNVADKVTFVPKGTYVSRVVASRHAEGRVYATFDGHRNDDYGVYAAVSENYGESWSSISANLAAGHTLSVIREHPRRESLLFVGTEFGAWVSFDRGKEWHRLAGKLPTVPVDDIAIHPRENDLILGTHGRSIWVLDDMTPLEKLADSVLDSELHLFDVRPATSYRIYNHKGNTGHKMFVAPNPPEGALVHYYLKSAAKEDVKITVLDREGKTVRELTGPKAAGLNRTHWDLRYPPPLPQVGEGGGFFGPPPGPRVLPGEYALKVASGGKEATAQVKVEDDPRIQVSDADRRAQLEALLRLSRMLTAIDTGQKAAFALKNQLGTLQESLKKAPSVPEAVTAAAKAMAEKVGQLEGKLSRTGGVRTGLGSAGPPPRGTPTPLYLRLNRLYGSLESYTEAPSPEQLERAEALSQELRGLLGELNQLIEEDVPGLNRLINQNNVPQILTGKPVEVPGED